jgi:hypothetical protein
VERRQAERSQVALPVQLEDGVGVTRDVSAAGVFFETERVLAVGTAIRLSLLLEHADPEGPLRLHCQGHVVRVEPGPGKVGVAVAITSYAFEPGAAR